MCLAIPGKIASIKSANPMNGGAFGDAPAGRLQSRTGQVNILGFERSVPLDLVPNAKVGDFVLVHAGYAIETVTQEYAQETLDLIQEFPDLVACNAQNI